VASNKNTPRWAQRDDIISYIVDCYAGTEPKGDHGQARRRVYLWEDPRTGDVMMGNTEAFAEHLRERFDLLQDMRTIAQAVHKLLRELGEVLRPLTTRERRGPGRPQVQPIAESWVVRRAAREDEHAPE